MEALLLQQLEQVKCSLGEHGSTLGELVVDAAIELL